MAAATSLGGTPSASWRAMSPTALATMAAYGSSPSGGGTTSRRLAVKSVLTFPGSSSVTSMPKGATS